jgi:hypothetical protein
MIVESDYRGYRIEVVAFEIEGAGGRRREDSSEAICKKRLRGRHLDVPEIA